MLSWQPPSFSCQSNFIYVKWETGDKSSWRDIRYHVFTDVPWQRLPLYCTNVFTINKTRLMEFYCCCIVCSENMVVFSNMWQFDIKVWAPSPLVDPSPSSATPIPVYPDRSVSILYLQPMKYLLEPVVLPINFYIIKLHTLVLLHSSSMCCIESAGIAYTQHPSLFLCRCMHFPNYEYHWMIFQLLIHAVYKCL